MDGEVELLSRNFSKLYRIGDSIATIVGRLQTEMQKAIDDYKLKQALFTNATFDSALATLQSNLEV